MKTAETSRYQSKQDKMKFNPGLSLNLRARGSRVSDGGAMNKEQAKMITLDSVQILSNEEYIAKLFENLPNFLSPEKAASIINKEVNTIYDMKSRPLRFGISREMAKLLFMKDGNSVLVRTDVLKIWYINRLTAA